ncbi:hypothetical protein [Caballeronia sp. LZ035]|uniref:hypothetical protein n=1 Tax=Caballeronia sp. LZ035 TaxID=3038568 RepID=UPI0028662DB7|nr:hypothetical protein [Caballeronia sp. LZ035]MDR5757027.1 hypothetical protein [Caballeronia sp. LZ035]
MRKLILATCLAAIAATASAKPIYQVAVDKALACPTGKQIIDVEETPDLLDVYKCRYLPKGFRFQSYTLDDRANFVSVEEIPDGTLRDAPALLRVKRSDINPVIENGEIAQSSCEWPRQTVMERLVAGKDGQIFLKKTLVTIKCLNGKSVQIYKPLN